MIVSKDDDFHHMSFTLRSPPKVIGLQLGNCTTRMIEDVLRANESVIQNFGAGPETTFLSLP